ncbi:MAG: hypothetical protein EXR58_00995 [Chloroflexi bacterium]|nr:hypothetical protein [Chloroflexota bacterium]
MERIVIFGSPGSGKSMLAEQIGERLGIPVFHLDRYLWKPGWVMVSREEEAPIVEHLIKSHEWIIDGDSGGTAMHVRLRAADTIVLLDLPQVICLWRALRRWIAYRGKSRPDMPSGCPERLDWPYLWAIWTYPSARLPRIWARIQEYAVGRKVFRLQTSSEVKQFLNVFDRSAAASQRQPTGPATPAE